MTRILRYKQTKLDQFLPPVSNLIGSTPEKVRYIDLDGDQHVLDYRELCEADTMPIPMPIDREGYGSVEQSGYYWATGYCDWLAVSDAIKRQGRLEELQGQRLRLLDFGCATGRFLRHAWVYGKDLVEPWGCDFAVQNIDWVKRYLPPEIRFVLNTNVPHLPFPDEFFDVVTAFSVFTHIADLEDAWLLELRRITSRNGLLYVTVQNEASWNRVPSRLGMMNHLLKANDIPENIPVSAEAFDGPMPLDRIVLNMSEEDVYHVNVWHRSDYVRKNWSRYFEILDIADNAHTMFQSPVIMRPLGGRRASSMRLPSMPAGEAQVRTVPRQELPTERDLEKLTQDRVSFVDRILTVIETQLMPDAGSEVSRTKRFGAAILGKSDLSTVVAVIESPSDNPLDHAGINAIRTFFELPADGRLAAEECVILCTREPCPLCLSAITWAGFKNFVYLFSYDDTREPFKIPQELKIMEEVFGCPDGGYSGKNHYWSRWGLRELIAGCDDVEREKFAARVESIRSTYDEMSSK